MEQEDQQSSMEEVTEEKDTSPRDQSMESEPDQVGEVVIVMEQGEELAWNTELDDSDDSTTSTPAFKRGDHGLDMQEITALLKSEAHTTLTRQRGYSIQILADARVQHWSKVDRVCKLEIHPGWDTRQWVSAIRAETIRITCHTVVLYFEKTATYSDVPPLKNGIQAVCKAIRQHHHTARIFVSNLLLAPSSSPLRRSRAESDFILLQAIRSVNRIMGRTHYLSLFEHFVSGRKSKIIKPTHKYFREDGDLTPLGCMIMRECLMQEVGIKNYWF